MRLCAQVGCSLSGPFYPDRGQSRAGTERVQAALGAAAPGLLPFQLPGMAVDDRAVVFTQLKETHRCDSIHRHSGAMYGRAEAKALKVFARLSPGRSLSSQLSALSSVRGAMDSQPEETWGR